MDTLSNYLNFDKNYQTFYTCVCLHATKLNLSLQMFNNSEAHTWKCMDIILACIVEQYYLIGLFDAVWPTYSFRLTYVDLQVQ